MYIKFYTNTDFYLLLFVNNLFFRNEDEVDEAEILEKVSKATASSFNFKVA